MQEEAPTLWRVMWRGVVRALQAAVLLSAGAKGHRYSFPHAKISTAPPILNRVFGQTVDAQLQVRLRCGARALMRHTPGHPGLGEPLKEGPTHERTNRVARSGAGPWTRLCAGVRARPPDTVCMAPACLACLPPQTNELEYATKYYAAILARATGKPLERCQKEYLSRKRWVRRGASSCCSRSTRVLQGAGDKQRARTPSVAVLSRGLLLQLARLSWRRVAWCACSLGGCLGTQVLQRQGGVRGGPH